MNYIPFIIIAIIVLCFKTIYKTLKPNKKIDDNWVKGYIIWRESIRMVLAVLLVVCSYFECMYDRKYTADVTFVVLVAVGGYIFIRSIVRMILVLTGHKWFDIKTSTCMKMSIAETGSDLDSSSVSGVLKTDVENFTFYGYGPSMYLTSQMKKDDKILIIRFRFRKSPYMLIGVRKV